MKIKAIALALILTLTNSPGVILYGSGDPAYNTTAPVFPDGTDGGWKFTGQWGSFLGTPISPHCFITAKHVGGSIGQPLIFRGVSYPTVARIPDPNSDSDLCIWVVSDPFPEFAQLYTLGDEQNKPFVVIGRGTQRGDPIYALGTYTGIYVPEQMGLTKKQAKALFPTAEFKGQQFCVTVTDPLIGWNFGPSDSVQRWGTNKWYVAGGRYCIAIFGENSPSPMFPDECYLSGGDSGGPCFMQVNGVWQLCAVNYGIDTFAAIFLSVGQLPLPARFYCSRIFYSLPWIQSVIN